MRANLSALPKIASCCPAVHQQGLVSSAFIRPWPHLNRVSAAALPSHLSAIPPNGKPSAVVLDEHVRVQLHKPVPGSTRTLCVTKVPHALTLPVEAHGPDGRPVLVLSAIDTLPSYRRRGLARDAIVVKGPLYALCTPLLSPPPISRLL